MKKIVTLLSGILALTTFGTAFAENTVACPPSNIVRMEGTKLFRGYMSDSQFTWVFYSSPYQTDPSTTWQTIFVENLPGVSKPSEAIKIAQDDLNNLALFTDSKSGQTPDGHTLCEYSPSGPGSNYVIYAVNYVDATLKQLLK